MKKVAYMIGMAIFALLFTACGTSGGQPPVQNPGVTEVKITSNVTGTEVQNGQLIELTAEVVVTGNASKEFTWTIDKGAEKVEKSGNMLKVRVMATEGDVVVSATSKADATKKTGVTYKVVKKDVPVGNPNEVTKATYQKWMTDNGVKADTAVRVCSQNVPGDPDNNWTPFTNSAEKVLAATTMEERVFVKMEAGVVHVYAVFKPFTAVLRSADGSKPAVTFSSPACPQ